MGRLRARGVMMVVVAAALVACSSGYSSVGSIDPEGLHDVAFPVLDRVVLEIVEGGEVLGEVEIGLFSDDLPGTVTNFLMLCEGVHVGSKFLSYDDNKIHRVVPGKMLMTGDVENRGGMGGVSAVGKPLKDEGFHVRFARPGVVGMVNSGKDSNKSQFFVTLSEMRDLNGKYVGFGQVLRGMGVLEHVAGLPATPSGSLHSDVSIRCHVQDKPTDPHAHLTDSLGDAHNTGIVEADAPREEDTPPPNLGRTAASHEMEYDAEHDEWRVPGDKVQRAKV